MHEKMVEEFGVVAMEDGVEDKAILEAGGKVDDGASRITSDSVSDPVEDGIDSRIAVVLLDLHLKAIQDRPQQIQDRSQIHCAQH